MPPIYLQRYLSHFQWQILQDAAAIANNLNFHLYAVGGIVRDCLWFQLNPGESLPLPSLVNAEVNSENQVKDLDLVVDIGARAGIEVAIALHQVYLEAKLQIHEKFQTAELIFPEFTIDLATAREEIYAYPGANPQVEFCDIDQDLYRRDFTINAMAVEILPARFTENSDTENSVTDNSSENSSAAEAQAHQLIDRFGGYADLLAQQLCPIRADSFAEDPRRIFRAVRFAHRFNLAIAPAAVAEIIQVMASGLHDGIGGSRLRAELQYILTPEFLPAIAAKMLRSLSDLGALRCIHAQFSISPEFELQLSRLHDWWQNLGANCLGISISQLSLELLLSALSPQFLAEIDLGLTPVQTKRLAQVDLISIALDNLSQPYLEPAKPSQICQILEKFDQFALLIWGAKEGDRFLQYWLWQYLSQWRKVKPMLTGNDLKKLGCPSGKAIGEVLSFLRAATLDGEIHGWAENVELAIKLISQLRSQG